MSHIEGSSSTAPLSLGRFNVTPGHQTTATSSKRFPLGRESGAASEHLYYLIPGCEGELIRTEEKITVVLKVSEGAHCL